MILPDLHSKRHTRRAEKQKIAEELVIISARRESTIREKLLESPPRVQVLKYR